MPISLVARFSALGAIVGLVLASALALIVERRATQLMCDLVASFAQDQIRLAFVDQVRAVDFDPPFAPEKLDGLDERLRPIMLRLIDQASDILRVHVFARDGTIVLSDVPDKRGEVVPPASSPLLAAALAGAVGSKLSALSSPENANLRERYGEALEIYVPFVLDGQVVAAYEIYYDVAMLRPVRLLAWGAAFGAFALLLLALLPVVRQAALRIGQHQAERERLLQQAAEAEVIAVRELDRLKSELLDAVSHELRTPLALIHGYAELLALRVTRLTPCQVEQATQEIHRASALMSRLVDDLLDFSRMERGRLSLKVDETDIAAKLRQIVELFAQQEGGERIVADIPPAELRARVDADRISQVAVNLVTNALRYAPSGPIHVRLRREPPGWATLEVRDTGPGIRPEVLARVWEKFYRGPEAMSSPIRGAGIGLTLVKTIAEAHGGTVAAESAPGNGATFRVSLPISPEICGGVEALDLASGRPAGTVQYAL